MVIIMKELNKLFNEDDLIEAMNLKQECQRIKEVYITDFIDGNKDMPESVYIKYVNDDESKNIIENYFFNYSKKTVDLYYIDYVDCLGYTTLEQSFKNDKKDYVKIDYAEWNKLQNKMKNQIKYCGDATKERNKKYNEIITDRYYRDLD